MERMKQFLAETQISSRVLVILWVFFGLAGSGFDASQFIYSFPIVAIFFLLPAILIERKKNPVWIKIRNESKIGEFESGMTKATQGDTNHPLIKNNDESVIDVSQEFQVATEPSEAHHPMIKDNSSTKEKKKKVLLSHRIGGVTLIVISSILCLLSFSMFSSGEKEPIFFTMFGFGGLLFGISFCCGKFMKFEQNKKCNDVFLSQEQIEKLEQKKELPTLDTPVFLNRGEVAVFHSQAARQEIKNRVIGRTGSYGGGTLRIAKGLSIHTGRSSSRPIYGDVAMRYYGELIITNERIIFFGNQKGFELKHQSITAATAYEDGFVFQSKNTSYVLLVPRIDLATLAFNGVRTGEIPIARMHTSDEK